jgi:hypothetical protein
MSSQFGGPEEIPAELGRPEPVHGRVGVVIGVDEDVGRGLEGCNRAGANDYAAFEIFSFGVVA